MRKRIVRGTTKWMVHTRDLPALCPGIRVLIQNQYGAGKISKIWDKSGMILEDLDYNKELKEDYTFVSSQVLFILGPR